MRLGRLCDPALDLAVLELVDPVAARTDEVMMMTGFAEPIAALPGSVGKLVDDLPISEHRQRAVDGREPDALAAVA